MATLEREETVKYEYDWENTAPSYAVIEVISAILNVEPIDLSEELDTTLFDHIDPDALDRLIPSNPDITISFMVEKYQIHIDGNELSVGIS